MKNYISMLLVFLSIVGNATNYYVAADGNDSNVGTSSATPFLTLTKISQLTSSNYIQSGDKIFLRKGDIFRGTLYLEYYENNNIQILAYGSGTKPIIKGSEIVTNWLPVETNLWVATISQAPKEVYANGTILTCARYPNSGFLFVDTGAAASLASIGISNSGIDFTGADVCLRTSDFSYERRKIESQTNNSITFLPTTYTTSSNRNFYITNCYSALDNEGEWFYDSASQQLFLFALSNPNIAVIEAGVYDYGIKTAYNISDCKVDGIAFQHQLNEAIWIAGNCNNTTVVNCDFSNLQTGMFIMKNNVSIQNNSFSDIYFKGIATQNLNNSIISNNTFQRIGKRIIQTEPSGNIAIYANGTESNTLITNNDLNDLGYIGIVILGTGNIVEKNVISNYLNVLSDGGAIYTCCNGTNSNIVRNNFITQIHGDLNGTADANDAIGTGIYLDNNSQQTVVENNTIYNLDLKTGISINWLSHSNTINANTVYNCRKAIEFNDTFANSIYGNSLTNNILYCIDEKAIPLVARSTQNTFNFGTFDYNYYCNPYTLYSTNRTTDYSGQPQQPLEAWRTLEPGNDIHTKRQPVSRTQNPIDTIVSSELLGINTHFDTSTTLWNCFSVNGNCTIDWASTPGFEGGALRFSHTGSSIGFVTSPSFTVLSNQWYCLKFKAKAIDYQDIEVVIKRNYGDYAPLQNIRHFPLTDAVQTFEITFKAEVSESPVSLIFQLNENTNPIWLDDISLQQITVQNSDTTADNPLLINPTASIVTLNLPNGDFVDIDGIATSTQQQLLPWSSRVLVRAATSLNTAAINQLENEVSIYPNPAHDYFTIQSQLEQLFYYEVYDRIGQKIKNLKVSKGNIKNQISSVLPGLYFIKIYDAKGKQISIKKIIIE